MNAVTQTPPPLTKEPATHPNIEQRSGETLELLNLGLIKQRLRLLAMPPRIDLVASLRVARALGVTPARWIREVAWMARGPGRLTQHEYCYYRLYDPSLPRDEARRFVGKRTQHALHSKCNDVRWYAVTHDKVLFQAAAAGFGLPVPLMRAVYSRSGRDCSVPVIRTPEALANYLRDASRYPLFLKPVEGAFSLGTLSLAAFDGDWIRFTTGETARVEQVTRFVEGFGGEGFTLGRKQLVGKGYLVQERLEAHKALRVAFGSTLPTIRFLVLLSPAGPAIESAVVKIPLSRHPADNYWRAGNMLGALGEAGTIGRVVIGVGAGLQEIATHPETGARLVGITLPNWQRAVELCLRAAAMFPGVRTQSWDVALTEMGPVILELNYGGDLNLHQLAHRRGALTPSYVAHLRDCGCRIKLP